MDPISLYFVGIGICYCILFIKRRYDNNQPEVAPDRIPVPHYNPHRVRQGPVIHIPAVARIEIPVPDIAPQRILTPDNIFEYKNITFKALENLGSGEWSCCSICLEPMLKNQNIQLLPCGHYYHNKCLTDWFKKKEIDLCCPMCNLDLNSRN